MSKNKPTLPMKGINSPRFFIWFRGFWHGKVIHTGGLDPETNTIASGYVTGQIINVDGGWTVGINFE